MLQVIYLGQLLDPRKSLKGGVKKLTSWFIDSPLACTTNSEATCFIHTSSSAYQKPANTLCTLKIHKLAARYFFSNYKKILWANFNWFKIYFERYDQILMYYYSMDMIIWTDMSNFNHEKIWTDIVGVTIWKQFSKQTRKKLKVNVANHSNQW